ncbi:MAG: DUF4349 domain-containing protein [Fibrobacter sp.]|nr:DUF4349 domain-containing protein [Fibrobacter sp.]
MKSLTFIIPVIALTFYSGCQKKVTHAYGSATQQAPRSVLQRKSSKSFVFDNSEVVGYLDNPSPVYIVDTDNEVLDKNIEKDDLSSLKAGLSDHYLNMNTLEGSDGQSSIEFDSRSQEQKVTVRKSVKSRMITYEGSVTARSSQVDSLLDLAVKIAKDVDGYLQNRKDNTVTIRVPSEKFDLVFDSLIGFGENTDFKKSAEDISDAFRDTDLRIQILGRTIERYLKLLSLVDKETEKLKLLKEIERLQGELEILEVQKKVLSSRAEFAIIHFTVHLRRPNVYMAKQFETAGFHWIEKLDIVNSKPTGKWLDFEVPSGMVKVENVRFWLTESPGGTRMWTARLRNDPGGTSRFWIDAIKFRLERRFLKSSISSCNKYKLIRFKPFPGSSYVYTVGVSVKDDEIYLLQMYFPDEEQEKRYFESIKEVISGEETL